MSVFPNLILGDLGRSVNNYKSGAVWTYQGADSKAEILITEDVQMTQDIGE